MEEHENAITTPPPTHTVDARHILEEEDDEREAQELRPMTTSVTAQSAPERAVARNYAESTARQSSKSNRTPRSSDGIRRWWTRHVAATVPHVACRDHLANERTYLGYLRTSLAFSMLGIVVAQLFRLQHSIDPSHTFGYFILGKPLAAVLEVVAMVTALIGAHRYWRQQTAMMRGKCWAGGWELVVIGTGALLISLALFALLVGVDVSKDI